MIEYKTLFLSRLMGLYCLIVALSMIVHKAAITELVADFSEAPPLLFIAGLFALVAGLALVLSHNIWSGGTLPVVVTVIGWVVLIRGIILVFISPGGAAAVYEALHFPQFFYLYVAIPFLLGAYLCIAGFRARAVHREAHA